MNETSWISTKTEMQPWVLPQAGGPQPALISRGDLTRLELLAEGFEPISLQEMDDVALLNRIDTKFILTSRQLLDALACLQPDYWMLSVRGQRLNHYRTLYFDTPAFALYHAHVNDRPERYKVRSREYTDSRLAFLEVKHRTRKDRTIKQRIPTTQPATRIDSTLQGWLRSVSPLDGGALEPKLWNTFTRLTLVSKQCCERVTLDIDLAFSTGHRLARLDGLAVAEVKMEMGHQASPFLAQMRAQRVRPRGFSKYAFGTALLVDQVKKNALKPKMLWVEKMMKGPGYDD